MRRQHLVDHVQGGCGPRRRPDRSLSLEVKRIFAKEGTKKSFRKKAMKKVPERNRSSHFKCINGALIVH